MPIAPVSDPAPSPILSGSQPFRFGMSLAELEDACEAAGFQRFRARQVYSWWYGKAESDPERMSNLPATLREILPRPRTQVPSASEESLRRTTMLPAAPVKATSSDDGTIKYLFPTEPGGLVEAASIPEERRHTLCLSTQVGCRRSCHFCMTARQGFQGNLSAGAILNQYHSLPERASVTNIVYMGMGEPLDNLEGTLASLSVLTDPEGYAFSRTRITVSTVGILSALPDFLDASPVNLALSLHSPFREERRKLMPVEAANPVTDVLELLRERAEDRRRRFSVEYTCFAGLNTTPAHARAIARLLTGLSARINLIPFHRIPDVELGPAGAEEISMFQQELRRRGLRAFVRRSRGLDVQAACGLLWTRHAQA